MKRLATTFFTLLFLAAMGLPTAQAQDDSNSCFLVADRTTDGGLSGNSPDRLTSIDRTTGEETDLGFITDSADNNVTNIEAIALGPTPGAPLYAANGNTLGTINPETGLYDEIGSFAGGPGELGFRVFDDVDGLMFDATDGTLYGVNREPGAGNPDLLFQIDPETGNAVQDAFGAGQTYVVIDEVQSDDGVTLFDIDDIAINPNTGNMLGLANDGSGRPQRNVIVNIDKSNGNTTRFNDPSLFEVGDVEGFTSGPGGTIFASTGNASRNEDGTPNLDARNSFYSVMDDGSDNKIAGPLEFRDYEGIACLNFSEDEEEDTTPPQCGPINIETNEDGRLTAVQQDVTDEESGIASVEFTVLRNLEGFLNDTGEYEQGDEQPFDPNATTTVTIRGERLDINQGGAIVTTVTNGQGLTAQCDPVVETLSSEVPSGFGLSQNYPNPFRGATTIQFQVAEPAHVSLEVYDVLGRKVATLVDEEKAPGTYSVRWTASESGSLASGVYLYQIQMGSFAESKRMVLVK